MKSFYISTPIYYPDDVPSIQTAYSTIAADCYARYQRMFQDSVFFVTGSDEHGQKVQNAAKARRMTPQAYVDKAVEGFKTVWQKLHISHDFFLRTSDDSHIKVVEDIFNKLVETGDVYRGTYSGWYCISCESFWPTALIKKDRKCPNKECRGTVDEIEEEGFFFKLSKYTGRILEYIEKNPDFIRPARRRNKAITLIKRGLEDLCITRKGLIWGIPVPSDPSFTIYVWFDALMGYLSASGYGTENFEKTWPADVQIIRKNILAFHAIIWPAFCFALNLPLPRMMFAHGAVNDCIKDKEGSRIACANLVELVDTFGSDAVRYYLLRESPFGVDFNFSINQLEHRLDNDLANDLGNLFHRTLSMVEKYTGGVIPLGSEPDITEKELDKFFRSIKNEYKKSMDRLEFLEALKSLWELIEELNRYIDASAPWDLHKNGNVTRLNTVLYAVTDYLRALVVMLQPFMPKAATKMYKQLGFKDTLRRKKFNAVNPSLTPPEQKIALSGHLFPKIEEPEPDTRVH